MNAEKSNDFQVTYWDKFVIPVRYLTVVLLAITHNILETRITIKHHNF